MWRRRRAGCSTDPAASLTGKDVHEGLAVPVRGVAGRERSDGAERQVEAGWDRDHCSEGCLNVAGAWRVAAAGCSRSRWTTASGSARRQRPRWTRRCGNGSCSVRRSTRCGTSVLTIATTSTSAEFEAYLRRFPNRDLICFWFPVGSEQDSTDTGALSAGRRLGGEALVLQRPVDGDGGGPERGRGRCLPGSAAGGQRRRIETGTAPSRRCCCRIWRCRCRL